MNSLVENTSVLVSDQFEKSVFDYTAMKRMIEKINTLGESEQYQIFNIIRENKQKFTENQNGVFINFNQLNISTLQQINQYVNFFEKQKQSFENHNKLLESMETLINNKINASGLIPSGTVGFQADSTMEELFDSVAGSDSLSAQMEVENDGLIQDLDDTEKAISGLVQKNSRKKDLALNKTKPHYSGSSARIAKKCNYLEGSSVTGSGTN